MYCSRRQGGIIYHARWPFAADAERLVASATIMSLAPGLCSAVAVSIKALRSHRLGSSRFQDSIKNLPIVLPKRLTSTAIRPIYNQA